MQKTVSTITPFSASAQAQKTPFTFDYIRSCTNPYKFRITEHIYLFVVPVIIEVKTAQQITDFTSGIKLLWNTVRTPHQSKLPSPSSMPPQTFAVRIFMSLFHKSFQPLCSNLYFMDLQTNADLDPQLLTGLPRLLYISKALVSKLFYEDIKPEHCTEEPLSSFISNHIYYIQLTCSIQS